MVGKTNRHFENCGWYRIPHLVGQQLKERSKYFFEVVASYLVRFRKTRLLSDESRDIVTLGHLSRQHRRRRRYQDEGQTPTPVNARAHRTRQKIEPGKAGRRAERINAEKRNKTDIMWH